MPEMPEVETIRLGLSKELVNHTVKGVEVLAPKSFIGNSSNLTGQKVTSLERRAKLLIINLEKTSLAIHLKMTGQLIFIPANGLKKDVVLGGHPDKLYTLDLPHKYTRVIFTLDNGTLYFNDLRRFGWIKELISPAELVNIKKDYGPEYNSPNFSLSYLADSLKKRPNTAIKQLLLDQTIIAGLGNIYTDEALFSSGILPIRKTGSLKPAEVKLLYKCIPEVLELSLKRGGTSSKDYLKSDGTKGTFLEIANVYKREKLPCKICGAPIVTIKVGSRTSRYCPHCQK